LEVALQRRQVRHQQERALTRLVILQLAHTQAPIFQALTLHPAAILVALRQVVAIQVVVALRAVQLQVVVTRAVQLQVAVTQVVVIRAVQHQVVVIRAVHIQLIVAVLQSLIVRIRAHILAAQTPLIMFSQFMSKVC